MLRYIHLHIWYITTHICVAHTSLYCSRRLGGLHAHAPLHHSLRFYTIKKWLLTTVKSLLIRLATPPVKDKASHYTRPLSRAIFTTTIGSLVKSLLLERQDEQKSFGKHVSRSCTSFEHGITCWSSTMAYFTLEFKRPRMHIQNFWCCGHQHILSILTFTIMISRYQSKNMPLANSTQQRMNPIVACVRCKQFAIIDRLYDHLV